MILGFGSVLMTELTVQAQTIAPVPQLVVMMVTMMGSFGWNNNIQLFQENNLPKYSPKDAEIGRAHV